MEKSRVSVWLDPCIIWEESGQGEGRWVCASSVLHPWAEYIHPAGGTELQGHILIGSTRLPTARGASPPPSCLPPWCHMVLWGWMSPAEQRSLTVWVALAFANHGGELPRMMPESSAQDIWCIPLEQAVLACELGGCGGMGLGRTWFQCLCMVAPVGVWRVPRRHRCWSLSVLAHGRNRNHRLMGPISSVQRASN